MKVFPPLCIFLLVFAINIDAQSVRQLERKAQKCFKKEAYSMTLFYSQAILKLDEENNNALHWASKSNEALNIPAPAYDPFSESSILPFSSTFVEPKIKNTTPAPTNLTLIVTTYNALDSSILNGTYIGITNDGFGQGNFHQNNEYENTATFNIETLQYYTVTSTKNMFSSEFTDLSTEDLLEKDTIYIGLYLPPARNKSVELFFDHNQPSSDTPLDSMTNLTYEETWLNYLYRINEYIDSSSIVDQAQAQADVGHFFANYVDVNFQQLEPFCQYIEGFLKKGEKISIVLEGSKGPLEADEDPLMSRRFNSIENFFSFYKNGLFKPWLANGDLSIERLVSNEESEAKNNNFSSPFDIEAAKMRKVILNYKIVKRE